MPRYIVLQIPTDFAALDQRLEIWGRVVKDRPHYEETMLYRHMKLYGKDDQRRWPDDEEAEARALSRGDYAEGWLIDAAWQSLKDSRSKDLLLAWYVYSVRDRALLGRLLSVNLRTIQERLRQALEQIQAAICRAEGRNPYG